MCNHLHAKDITEEQNYKMSVMVSVLDVLYIDVRSVIGNYHEPIT